MWVQSWPAKTTHFVIGCNGVASLLNCSKLYVHGEGLVEMLSLPLGKIKDTLLLQSGRAKHLLTINSPPPDFCTNYDRRTDMFLSSVIAYNAIFYFLFLPKNNIFLLLWLL